MQPIADTAKLQQIHHAKAGYIYNDFSGEGPRGGEYNILHRAACRYLDNATVPAPKRFDLSLDAAVQWLNENRGPEGQNWKRCDAPNCECFG